MSYTDTVSSLLPEYQFNLDAWPRQLKICKCHFPLVLKKHEDAVFKRFLFFIIFKIYARIGCFEYQARTAVILKILSRAFFFFFSFDFSSHLNFSFVLSLCLPFFTVIGRTIKMKIFGPCHVRTANGDRDASKRRRNRFPKTRGCVMHPTCTSL